MGFYDITFWNWPKTNWGEEWGRKCHTLNETFWFVFPMKALKASFFFRTFSNQSALNYPKSLEELCSPSTDIGPHAFPGQWSLDPSWALTPSHSCLVYLQWKVSRSQVYQHGEAAVLLWAPHGLLNISSYCGKCKEPPYRETAASQSHYFHCYAKIMSIGEALGWRSHGPSSHHS